MKNTIPSEAYRYFCELCKIPHGSGNEKAISDYLAAFAKEIGLDAVQDAALNVLIRKGGSAGREHEAPVILQAHTDMVCEKNEDSPHDFLKDPIVPIIDGDWVKANGTTLGADNASGVSIIMALLAAKDLSHPPIEALLTTGEEVGCVGAEKFDVSLLKGKRLINLDSEGEGVFTVSSASAVAINLVFPFEQEDIPEGFAAYMLKVRGLIGGHSAVDINKGRANANVAMGRLLDMLYGENVYIADISGGSKGNAIPRECTACILLAESRLEAIKSIAAQAEEALKREFPVEKTLAVTLEKTNAPKKVMSRASLRKLIDGILRMPSGVQSMSRDIEGLVQTSNNLSVITTGESQIKLNSLMRSSMLEEMDVVIEKIKQLAANLGAAANDPAKAPVWKYRSDSPLRNTMAMVFKDMYGRAPEIAATHGGLECAEFAAKMPDGDFIAIGVYFTGAHSPDEKMNIPSFERTCEYVIRVLEKL